MKKLVMVVLVLVMVGLSNAAIFTDDFTSNTLGDYSPGLLYTAAPGRTSTYSWDGSTMVNLVSIDGGQVSTLLNNQKQRAIGSSVSTTFAGGPMGDEYPSEGWKSLGVVISSTMLDDSLQGWYANFRGYQFVCNGTASYFSVRRVVDGTPTDIYTGNPVNGYAWWSIPMTLTVKANGSNFEFYFENAWSGGPELLFTDSSGTLQDSSLKYFGATWGTGTGAFDSAQWNPARLDKIEVSNVIPEPATLALLSLGLLTVVRRRKSA